MKLSYMGGAIPVQALPPHQGVFPYPEGAQTTWLNSGRAAFEYILRSLPYKPKRVWLPQYICHTLLEPLQRLQLPTARYRVDAQLHPLLPPDTCEQDVLVLVNYFGLTQEVVAQAAAQAPCPVVVDATTAFYCPPLPHVPTFYSPRKFAGLADGGIAVGVGPQEILLEEDTGSDIRTANLLQHYSTAAVEHAEAALSCPPKRMGKLTRELMLRTPWQAAAAQRLRNYDQLHRQLACINRLALPQTPTHAPFCYPLVCGIPGLRDELIDAGIRLPLYWPEVIAETNASDTENQLARTLLPLPLDARYTEQDMQRLLSLILN